MSYKALILACIPLIGLSGIAKAVPVDLFTFDVVDSTVTVFGADNASATITEDSTFAPVGLWEFDLPIPNDARELNFSFDLQVAPGNEDYFDFYFGSLAAPSISFGGFEGSYSDTLTEDLLAFRGGTLELAFALNYGWADAGFDSVLTIENVDIALSQVPAPPVLWLLGAGLLAWRGAPVSRTTRRTLRLELRHS